ncbi:MAG: hypothetical protein ACYS47_02815 [Planctomycetota bacterium]|jgi:hypothetical protein
MSKILTLVLTGAAFAVAAYLVLVRRPIPNPSGARGLHRGFLISVALFASLLIAMGCKQEDQWHRAWCYDPGPDPERERKWALEETRRKQMIETLREVWVTLDQSRAGEFDRLADQAKGLGAIRVGVAEVLKTAFAELSFHRHRLESRVTCYKPTPLGAKTMSWRERILLQLQTLAKARRQGVLDVGTVSRVLASMELDLERLHWARQLTSRGISTGLEGEGPGPPSKSSDSAREAARIIEKFETTGPPRER